MCIEAAHKTVAKGSDEDLFCILQSFVTQNKKFRQFHGQYIIKISRESSVEGKAAHQFNTREMVHRIRDVIHW